MKDLLKQLQELAPLAAQATTGPWAVKTNGNTVQSHAIEGVCSGMSTKNGNAAFIAAARNLLTPENLTQLVAALALQWPERNVAEAMRWVESEVSRMEAENETMYKTARVEDVQTCRYNSVRIHTLKTLLQRLGSAEAAI